MLIMLRNGWGNACQSKLDHGMTFELGIAMLQLSSLRVTIGFSEFWDAGCGWFWKDSEELHCHDLGALAFMCMARANCTFYDGKFLH